MKASWQSLVYDYCNSSTWHFYVVRICSSDLSLSIIVWFSSCFLSNSFLKLFISCKWRCSSCSIFLRCKLLRSCISSACFSFSCRIYLANSFSLCDLFSSKLLIFLVISRLNTLFESSIYFENKFSNFSCNGCWVFRRLGSVRALSTFSFVAEEYCDSMLSSSLEILLTVLMFLVADTTGMSSGTES